MWGRGAKAVCFASIPFAFCFVTGITCCFCHRVGMMDYNPPIALMCSLPHTHLNSTLNTPSLIISSLSILFPPPSHPSSPSLKATQSSPFSRLTLRIAGISKFSPTPIPFLESGISASISPHNLSFTHRFMKTTLRLLLLSVLAVSLIAAPGNPLSLSTHC